MPPNYTLCQALFFSIDIDESILSMFFFGKNFWNFVQTKFEQKIIQNVVSRFKKTHTRCSMLPHHLKFTFLPWGKCRTLNFEQFLVQSCTIFVPIARYKILIKSSLRSSFIVQEPRNKILRYCGLAMRTLAKIMIQNLVCGVFYKFSTKFSTKTTVVAAEFSTKFSTIVEKFSTKFSTKRTVTKQSFQQSPQIHKMMLYRDTMILRPCLYHSGHHCCPHFDVHLAIGEILALLKTFSWQLLGLYSII